jgi:hypothetical protein
MTDIINPKLQLQYRSENNAYKIENITLTIQSSDSKSSDGTGYTPFTTTASSSSSLNASLDPFNRYHRIDAKITLRHITTNTLVSQEHTYFYDYSDITIKTIDTVTLQTIPSVSLKIAKLDSNMSIVNATTNINGEIKVYIDEGTYRFNALDSTSYLESVKDILIKESESLLVELPLTPKSIENQGSLSGIVTDKNGKPIQDALIKISGGALTNGYFASTTTDENGFYKLTSISLLSSKDYNKTEIESFSLHISKKGFASQIRDEVIVLKGKDRVENFSLMEENTIEDDEYIYKTTFDDISTWEKTGLWHQHNLINSIQNTHVLNGNVLLAPDDNSSGYLPQSTTSNNLFWFGNPTHGSFIDNGIENRPGGTANNFSGEEGKLISPEIEIPSDTNTTLRFNTWWEIESVNPNGSGYDLLEIYIIEKGKTYGNQCDDKSSWINNYENKILSKWGIKDKFYALKDNLLDMEWATKCGYHHDYIRDTVGDIIKKLNPAIDPPIDEAGSIEEREKLAFSSAGFNRKPIWTQENIDLSEYAGKTIQVKFRFYTKDHLYNGFRGWMIDDFHIIDKAKLNQ